MSVASLPPLTRQTARVVFAALAPLFRYPDERWVSNVGRALEHIGGATGFGVSSRRAADVDRGTAGGGCATTAASLSDRRDVAVDRDTAEGRCAAAAASPSGRCEAAAEQLKIFAASMGSLDTRQRQTLYTSTFDLAPSCSPYLGAHRFGDESPERARLMVGLRMRYGGEQATELPDHIAEIFAFAGEFYEDEWADLERLVIAPAVDAMEAILRPTSNPYRHLLAAVRGLCGEASPERGIR